MHADMSEKDVCATQLGLEECMSQHFMIICRDPPRCSFRVREISQRLLYPGRKCEANVRAYSSCTVCVVIISTRFDGVGLRDVQFRRPRKARTVACSNSVAESKDSCRSARPYAGRPFCTTWVKSALCHTLHSRVTARNAVQVCRDNSLSLLSESQDGQRSHGVDEGCPLRKHSSANAAGVPEEEHQVWTWMCWTRLERAAWSGLRRNTQYAASPPSDAPQRWRLLSYGFRTRNYHLTVLYSSLFCLHCPHPHPTGSQTFQNTWKE